MKNETVLLSVLPWYCECLVMHNVSKLKYCKGINRIKLLIKMCKGILFLLLMAIWKTQIINIFFM